MESRRHGSSGRRAPSSSPSPSRRGRRQSPSGAAGVALRRKVRELQRLVPGGDEAPAGSLLLRAADYIVQLRARVELLRALSALYDPPRHDLAAGA